MRILTPRICSLSGMTVPIRRTSFLEICGKSYGSLAFRFLSISTEVIHQLNSCVKW